MDIKNHFNSQKRKLERSEAKAANKAAQPTLTCGRQAPAAMVRPHAELHLSGRAQAGV